MKYYKLIIISFLFFAFSIGCNSKDEKKVYYVSKTPQAPLIDGEIDNTWSSAKFEAINEIKYGNEFISDSLDLSAKFKILWDDSNLYFLYIITDDIKYDIQLLKYKEIDAPPSYECDNVGLLFSTKNPDKKSFSIDEGDFNFGYTYSNATISSSNSTNDIKFFIKNTSSGYVLEAMIPFKTLLIQQPDKGTSLGFETVVNDNDNNAQAGIYLVQRSFLTWAEKTINDESYKNTSVFGRLILN